MNSDGATTTNDTEFIIPEQFFAPIHEWFSGATVDPKPALWIGGGALTVTTRSGQRYYVAYYHTRSSVDAFSVHCASPTRERRYYQNGSARQLYELLERARAEAERGR